ncbi:MAG: zinc ABC transporter substrate-binding protein [Candidatus Marinimicrobia bacterium]|nr:zinc ABC transporter substrate-binding protein [Candidatus Neomarinimicrobiota bacterium]MBL7022489.1 zinc ABC transporter substrate-binding protein [Candidatus Neomarinimicrobiota bacterium]MBL7108656.1 zinc ABC transporter substrate-binding protein [Candidatus Neomarinimicrobiota bacterium]
MKKLTVLMLLVSTILFGKVRVVTSITDFEDIAKTIGGKRITVTSIARGNQDPHYVEVLPSYMMKVRRADVYLQVGMELDLWSRQIIDGSRNNKLQIVDCSQNINRLEVPTDKIDASMGDIHSKGNPHYWLDPINGIIIAETITNALIEADPDGREYFTSQLLKFTNDVNQLMKKWEVEFKNLVGKKVIFYHNSWPYFSERFGLEVVQFVEPKPGITPTPTHLDKLIRIIQSDNVKVMAMEPYFSNKAPDFLNLKTGVNVVKIAQSVGAISGVDSYIQMFEFNLKALTEALEK